MPHIASPLLRTPVTARFLRGCVDPEETNAGIVPHRLPAWARRQWVDPQLAMAEAQPSGVRVCLRTAATVIELEALPTKRVYVGMPPRPEGLYALTIDGTLVQERSIPSGDVIRIDLSAVSTNGRPTMEMLPGTPGRVSFAGLPEGDKDVEIWLPHNEAARLIALHSDAPVLPPRDAGRRVWLHHGSSISQGSDAVSPTGTWPAQAASIAGVELLNLGFGGSALLDPFVARTIRDMPADIISLKLGINIVNMDLMRLRAFGPALHGFLDTIREGHADTPVLVVSPILCPIHEHTPGPSIPDLSDGAVTFRAIGDPAGVAAGKLTLDIIRTAMKEIVEQRMRTDPNIHYLDGRSLYGHDDHARHPLPDGLHPDAHTHQIIGRRFAEAAFGDASYFG